MNRSNSRVRGLPGAVLVLVVLVLGCQASGTTQQRQWDALPIESFASVKGMWAGILVSKPKARQDDWVRLAIGDDGRYVFESYRTIGVFEGHGQFSVTEGKLTVTTDRGSATGSLFASDGARMLRFLGVMKDGAEYTAELEPAK